LFSKASISQPRHYPGTKEDGAKENSLPLRPGAGLVLVEKAQHGGDDEKQ
jgi:hypothetical protein